MKKILRSSLYSLRFAFVTLLCFGISATTLFADTRRSAHTPSVPAIFRLGDSTTSALSALWRGFPGNSTGTSMRIPPHSPDPIQPPTPQPSSAPNLILNPTFTATSSSNGAIMPQSWIPASWGAAAGAVFNFPVAGEDDGFAAQTKIATYDATGEGNGAAEWLPNAVPVIPDSLYTFSDWYESDTNSYVDAQWTLKDGSYQTDSVATLGPTGGSWSHDTEVFSAPANAVALTMVHDIQSVGTLTVDNFSLTAGMNQTQTAFSKALVSLTFDDGWESQYVNALPILQAAHLPGTFYIITDAIRNSIYDFFTDPGEAILAAATSASVTWSPIYTDPGVRALTFSDTYTASSPSTIEADYMINGVASSTIIGTLPPGTNAQANFSFTLPTEASSTVTPISITHSSAGPLTASNPSLKENVTGYMTVSQLQNLQAAGNELASHAVTHPDLTAIPSWQVTQELANSRSSLISWGASPNDGFAYPFGNYNSSIEAQTAAAGYADARTVEIGYNTKSTDAYALKTQGMLETTPFSEVKSWIDTATADKLWLVITFHDIDSQNVLTANGEIYGTTPQLLQQIVTYLGQQQAAGNIQVETVHDALPFMR